MCVCLCEISLWFCLMPGTMHALDTSGQWKEPNCSTFAFRSSRRYSLACEIHQRMQALDLPSILVRGCSKRRMLFPWLRVRRPGDDSFYDKNISGNTIGGHAHFEPSDTVLYRVQSRSYLF